MKFRDPARRVVVTVSSTPLGERLQQFDINDNGIEPEYRERVFVVFQRLHTREQYDGTGIGLPLCRKIVEFHGGTIDIDDNPAGVGTRFRFTLPTTEPADATPTGDQAPQPTTRTAP